MTKRAKVVDHTLSRDLLMTKRAKVVDQCHHNGHKRETGQCHQPDRGRVGHHKGQYVNISCLWLLRCDIHRELHKWFTEINVFEPF